MMYDYETALIKQKYKLIAGIDEAGRGPLAGPLVVALVILPLNYTCDGLNDSKKLSAKKRELLYEIIIKDALYYEIEIVDIDTIDKLNIYQATKLAMQSLAIASKAEYILTDAMPLENVKHEAIIKGDAKSLTIAAASILAKVTRDRLMLELDLLHPDYGFKQHKGYGTKMHMEAIFKYGPSPVHRKTYKPVSDLIKGKQ